MRRKSGLGHGLPWREVGHQKLFPQRTHLFLKITSAIKISQRLYQESSTLSFMALGFVQCFSMKFDGNCQNVCRLFRSGG